MARRTVGDYVTLIRGNTYKGALVGKPGPALLGLGSIEPGGGFRTSNYDTYGGDCPQELMLVPGDLYVSLKGATKDGKMIGSVARVPQSVASGRLTQDTVKLVFRESEAGMESFLYWMLRTPHYREYCAAHATGSAVVALSRQDFLSYPLPEPTKSREVLVEFLNALEAKIERNREINETLDAITRAIFKSWFVDFDPVRAKSHGEPPESICRRLKLTPDLLALFPDRLVDSELGEIPEGWDTITLGSVANVTKGKSYKSSELEPSATALVTLKSFNRGGGYRLDGLKEYTGSYRGEQEVFPGELIVAFTDVTQAADIVGRPALIVSDSRYKHLVISLDVAVVRPKSPEYRLFLYGLMSEDAFQQHARAHTTGTTVLHLAAGAVPGFKFAWPGGRLVETYSALALPIFEFIDSQVGVSRSLGSARDALLPKLLSGELRVPPGGAA